MPRTPRCDPKIPAGSALLSGSRRQGSLSEVSFCGEGSLRGYSGDEQAKPAIAIASSRMRIEDFHVQVTILKPCTKCWYTVLTSKCSNRLPKPSPFCSL